MSESQMKKTAVHMAKIAKGYKTNLDQLQDATLRMKMFIDKIESGEILSGNTHEEKDMFIKDMFMEVVAPLLVQTEYMRDKKQ